MNKRTRRSWEIFVLILGTAIVALGLYSEAKADNYQHAVGYICCSYHQERDKGFNENNDGVYYRYNVGDDSLFMVGNYENSFHRQSTFIGYGPRWNLLNGLEVSIPVGFVTGYLDRPSPFALPTITIRDTVNIHFIPGVVYAASFNIVRW